MAHSKRFLQQNMNLLAYKMDDKKILLSDLLDEVILTREIAAKIDKCIENDEQPIFDTGTTDAWYYYLLFANTQTSLFLIPNYIRELRCFYASPERKLCNTYRTCLKQPPSSLPHNYNHEICLDLIKKVKYCAHVYFSGVKNDIDTWKQIVRVNALYALYAPSNLQLELTETAKKSPIHRYNSMKMAKTCATELFDVLRARYAHVIFIISKWPHIDFKLPIDKCDLDLLNDNQISNHDIFNMLDLNVNSQSNCLIIHEFNLYDFLPSRMLRRICTYIMKSKIRNKYAIYKSWPLSMQLELFLEFPLYFVQMHYTRIIELYDVCPVEQFAAFRNSVIIIQRNLFGMSRNEISKIFFKLTGEHIRSDSARNVCDITDFDKNISMQTNANVCMAAVAHNKENIKYVKSKDIFIYISFIRKNPKNADKFKFVPEKAAYKLALHGYHGVKTIRKHVNMCNIEMYHKATYKDWRKTIRYNPQHVELLRALNRNWYDKLLKEFKWNFNLQSNKNTISNTVIDEIIEANPEAIQYVGEFKHVKLHYTQKIWPLITIALHDIPWLRTIKDELFFS